MGKSNSLLPTQRAQILVHFENGQSQRQISTLLGCSKTAVQQAISRYHFTGSFNDRARCGCPRKTSTRQDRIIRRAVVSNPRISTGAVQSLLAEHGASITTQTIRNRLDEFGLNAYHPARKPRLTPAMKQKRLQFARKYAHWTVDQWSKVMFSDESSFQQFADATQWIRRPRGQRYQERFTVPVVKHSPAIMVWGCFSHSGVGSLIPLQPNERVNGQRYIQILGEQLPMNMAIHDCDFFQQDLAPCHTAKICRKWFNDHHIQLLDWPGNSPDLNPIENLWGYMKKQVSCRKPSSLPELRSAILQVWTAGIPQSLCQSLISSLPRRLAKVIASKGGITGY
jgi:transposase